MTIHSDHPFQVPDGERRPERRFRGRMPAPVTVLATGTGAGRAGLTVSSLLVADGEPARVLALVDEESALAEALPGTGTVAVSVLGWEQRAVADVFAGIGPSPGGPFRTGSWSDSGWGPVLDHCPAWAGCRVVPEKPRAVGWSLLFELTIEHVGLGDDAEALAHRRGRYLRT
ncbi:MAG: flavin reductase [Nocardioidaceae bacterium]|nr:flavin reductase [Nocardioidaceae bacterium]